MSHILAKLFLKNSTWYLSVSFKGKRVRRSLGTNDRKLAVILSNNAEILILEELLGISKKAHTISPNELISQFLNHNPNWSDATKKWYRVAIFQYLNKRTNSSYNKAVNVLLNYAKYKGYDHDIPIPKPVK